MTIYECVPICVCVGSVVGSIKAWMSGVCNVEGWSVMGMWILISWGS